MMSAAIVIRRAIESTSARSERRIRRERALQEIQSILQQVLFVTLVLVNLDKST